MFSLHFLAPPDNRPKVDSTSYCMRFPVFHFRGWHDFPQPVRNILSQIIRSSSIVLINIIIINGGGVRLLRKHADTDPSNGPHCQVLRRCLEKCFVFVGLCVSIMIRNTKHSAWRLQAHICIVLLTCCRDPRSSAARTAPC